MDHIVRSDLEALLKQLGRDEFRSKRITVTGGAGFIGSWLCDIFALADSNVRCLDNLCTGFIANIEHLLKASKFTFQEFDVTRLNGNDEPCDMILHFASRASPEDYQRHPIETLTANSLGTQNVLELARKNDATVVYASSSEVYGDAELVPTPETYWGKVNSIGPRSCYDEGKRYGEALCMAYKQAHDLDVRITRIFNSYGPRLRSDGFYGRALSRFIDQALSGRDITVYGKGNQTRSFSYITDTVAAILRTATQNEMKGEVINIGNPNEVTILELARKIKAMTNSKSEITLHPRLPDDPQRRCPDISKAKRILDWSPSVTLEDGLQKTIEWFTRHQLGEKQL